MVVALLFRIREGLPRLAQPGMEFVSNVQLAGLPDEIAEVSRDIEVAALPRADAPAAGG